MKALTLRQLRYFDALARHLHFGRAARECAVSQPALSMQIAQLEDEMGAALVERHRTRVLLTDAGQVVAARARDILHAVGDMAAQVRHGSAVLAGRLTLGVIPSLAPYILPRILPRLHTDYPRLDLILREAQTERLMQELDAGAVDAALLSLPIEGAGFESIGLFDDPFLLAYRAGGKPRKPAEILASERLLLLEEGHCLRDQALSFCRTLKRGDTEVLSATSLFTIMQMVAQGYGATLLPQVAVDAELRGHPDIRAVRFPAPQPMRRIGLAYRASSPRGKDFSALAKSIKSSVMKKPA